MNAGTTTSQCTLTITQSHQLHVNKARSIHERNGKMGNALDAANVDRVAQTLPVDSTPLWQ